MNGSKTEELARQALGQLVTELEAGQSEQLKAYLAMMGRFRAYSPTNILLICMQCPQASHVAGYRICQRLGRQVRRGAKAIRILAPIVRRALPEDKEDTERVIAFKAACVFDASHTEGKPLPDLARAEGDPGDRLECLRRLIRARGIDLRYPDRLGGAEGIAGHGEIVLKTGLPLAEEFAVMVHELAHVIIHHNDQVMPASKKVRETEAEAVAFVVCQAVGLDTNSAASDYIQLYQGDRETLVASMGRIQKTAAEIIDGVLGEGQSKAPGSAGERMRAPEPLPAHVKRLAA